MRSVLKQLRDSIKASNKFPKYVPQSISSSSPKNVQAPLVPPLSLPQTSHQTLLQPSLEEGLSPTSRASLIDATFLNLLRREFLRLDQPLLKGRLSTIEFKRLVKAVGRGQMYRGKVTRVQVDKVVEIMS